MIYCPLYKRYYTLKAEGLLLARLEDEKGNTRLIRVSYLQKIKQG